MPQRMLDVDHSPPFCWTRRRTGNDRRQTAELGRLPGECLRSHWLCAVKQRGDHRVAANEKHASGLRRENIIRIVECPFLADFVAKVENRTTPKISRMLTFRLL